MHYSVRKCESYLCRLRSERLVWGAYSTVWGNGAICQQWPITQSTNDTMNELFWEKQGWNRSQRFLSGVRSDFVRKGYKDVVIHVSLLEVVHNGVLIDLAEQHHVVHSTMFDIVALPVVPVVAPAPLQQKVLLFVHCVRYTMRLIENVTSRLQSHRVTSTAQFVADWEAWRNVAL